MAGELKLWAGERLALSQVVRDRNSVSGGSQPSGKDDVERIRWVEFGKEHVSEFCEATDPSGHFESNSSQGHKEYEDRLRAIAMREEGAEKAEIAAALGRSQHFVQTWWRQHPKEVPRPLGVHDYLKTEYWRDVQILRGFGTGLGIYDEVVAGSEWQQQMAWGNDFRNGGRVIKYDKEGRMKPMGNQQAKGGYEAGRMPNLDAVTQKMLSELGIQDRVLTRPGLLWYPDGSADAVPHRHECWTALMSFGAPRILTIDGSPVLLRDGDLIVFGTQRHGVPRMCAEGRRFEDHGGRISAVFFFMPQGQQAHGANPWRPIVDQPSRQLSAWSKDWDLGAEQELVGLRAGPLAGKLAQLRSIGFADEAAAAALRAVDFDLEMAAEALLSGAGPALLLAERPGPGGGARQSLLAALYACLEALHPGVSGAARGAAAAPCSVAASVEEHCSENDDAALALRLQQEEAGSCGAFEDDEQAILAQIQELECEGALEGVDEGALQAQFAQYEEMLDHEDASQWDGRGDLMAFMGKREHLQIEQQDPVVLYAFGCGSSTEKDFFELLSLHSVRVLCDLRADPTATSYKHFATGNLGLACKARAVIYRHVALGREGAYGILKHLKEDEGRNVLAELVWQAQRKRTAFLGAEADWRLDHRQAIAMRLTEAGHSVLHVLSDGSTERHPDHVELPEFIQSEEARLRKLEKQRLAGEPAPHKSTASRSTEVVVQKLTKPQQVIDVGAELRKATNQTELCRIQRHLADLQRKSEGPDAKAGLGPKLVAVNKWVKLEAAEQRENLAAGKTKDGRERKKDTNAPPPPYVWLGTGGTSGGNTVLKVGGGSSSSGSTSSTSSTNVGAMPLPEASLMVECCECRTALPWERAADGVCGKCLSRCSVSDECGTVPGTTAARQELASVAGLAGAGALPSACADVGLAAASAKPSWRARRHHIRAARQDA